MAGPAHGHGSQQAQAQPGQRARVGQALQLGLDEGLEAVEHGGQAGGVGANDSASGRDQTLERQFLRSFTQNGAPAGTDAVWRGDFDNGVKPFAWRQTT